MDSGAKSDSNSDSRLQGEDEEQVRQSRHQVLWVGVQSGPASQPLSRPTTPFDPPAVDTARLPRRVSNRLDLARQDPEEFAILLQEKIRAATQLRNEQLRMKTPSISDKLERASRMKLEIEITLQERRKRLAEEKRKRIAKRLEEIEHKWKQMELEKMVAREEREKVLKERIATELPREEETIQFELQCQKECEDNQNKYPIKRDVFEPTKTTSRLRRWWNEFLGAVRSSSCFGGRRSNRVHAELPLEE